jgi:enamine deaminase RidA (YjgF/YER057c/UK114 family)
MSAEDRLKSLGLTLPPAPQPVASYIPAVRSGNLLFLSGILPMKDGKPAWTGKLGRELTIEQGADAARLACLNALAVIRSALGSLDAVERIVRLGGHVASAGGFTQQPAVVNGASDLLVAIFGEAGRHARLALGAHELPLGAAIELELIVEIRRNPENHNVREGR